MGDREVEFRPAMKVNFGEGLFDWRGHWRPYKPSSLQTRLIEFTSFDEPAAWIQFRRA
jgi:hypothetical protein